MVGSKPSSPASLKRDAYNGPAIRIGCQRQIAARYTLLPSGRGVFLPNIIIYQDYSRPLSRIPVLPTNFKTPRVECPGIKNTWTWFTSGISYNLLIIAVNIAKASDATSPYIFTKRLSIIRATNRSHRETLDRLLPPPPATRAHAHFRRAIRTHHCFLRALLRHFSDVNSRERVTDRVGR